MRSNANDAVAARARDPDDPNAPLPRFLSRPAGDRDDARAPSSILDAVIVVLLPLAAGYYLGYLYRTISALIAEELVTEFALSAADLGALTATLFLTFALMQLPLGTWLDRFGPRRVQAILLSVAAAGATLFACAQGFIELAIGRALIGIGVAGALMAGLKGIVLWFPAERVALANGWFITIGALGAVTATAPAELVLATIGWRGVFAFLAVVTAACALLILLVVPERRREREMESVDAGVDIFAIYRDPRFWRLAPLSATCIGSAWALQGLWAGPWLADVEGLARHDVVLHLALMAIALSASAVVLGAGADQLRRHGISLSTSLAMATAATLLAQLALVLRWPLPTWLPWIPVAGMGAGTVLSYAILTELFPKSASGRANGALNLLHVSSAFAVQVAIGLVVQQWPAEAGRHPPIAYQTALGLNLALQIAAFLWFVRPERCAITAHLAAHPIHALAATLGVVPDAAVPYLHARNAWSARRDHARRQMEAWRAVALASVAVLGLISIALAATISGRSFAAEVQVARVVRQEENWITTGSLASAPPFRSLIPPD